MKTAKLPTGNVLRFPDETDDEAIDKAVQEHMRDHIERKNKELKIEAELKQRHDDLVKIMTHISGVLSETYKLLRAQTAAVKELLEEQKKHHKNSASNADKIVKAINTPRKRRALRDKNGKLEGAEEYV